MSVVHRTGHAGWSLRILSCVVLLAAAAWIHRFDVLHSGLDVTGPALVAYHVARLAVTLLVGWAMYGCGRLLTAVGDRVETALLGFCVVSLLMFVLGLAGLLYPSIAGTLILTLLLLTPVPAIRPQDLRIESVVIAGAGIALLAMILFVAKALLVAEGDNDVWEHYLHYYDMVVERHSLAPNDLWVHFFVSKAAGSFFLVSLLGDVFCVQLVSFIAIGLMALAMGEFVRSASGAPLAGLLAMALVLAGWNAVGGEAGSMLKHHTVVAMLFAGCFYCAWTSREVNGARARAALVSGACAAFYLGLYITVASAILAVALGAVSIVFAVERAGQRRAWGPAVIGVAAILGGGCALVLNYVWTGLALDAPVGVFWQFADRERFARLWNPLIVEYWFLGPASVESSKLSLGSLFTPDTSWWGRLLRVSFLSPLLLMSSAFVGAGAVVRTLGSRREASASGSRAWAGITSLLAFVLGAAFVAQLFRNSESVYRLYAFVLPFLMAGLALCCYSGARLAGIESHRSARWLIVLAGAAGAAFLLAQVPSSRWQVIAKYAAGAISTKDSLRVAEESFAGRFSIAYADEFRAKFPDGRRILFLTYDPAPAYFVPGPPVVSEPSYAFNGLYEELLFSDDSRRVEKILRDEGIGYVGINLRNRLFLGLPFTQLFSPQRIDENFSLVWQRGDIYILGWRDDGVGRPIPDVLRRALQVRHTGIVPPDAEALWGRSVAEAMRGARKTRDQSSDDLGWLYEEMRKRTRNHPPH